MKILWTFDPFEKNKKLRMIGKNLLLNLSDYSDRIKAAYVASPSEISLATAFDVPKKNRFSAYPKKIIKSQLRSLKLKSIMVLVLPELEISLTSSVKKIASYALNSKTDLIVTATNGKTGFSRLLMGSFAETLVHTSQTDLLLYNEHTQLTKKPKSIVYAHDFSRKGIDGIQKLIKYAYKWDASITVVHVPKPEYGIHFIEQDESVDLYRQHVKKVAHSIEAIIKKRGIHCTTFIETDWKKSEVQSILSIAKNVKAEIIAVTAKSGRMTALLGGSVTRNIIRKSNIPTLVLKI